MHRNFWISLPILGLMLAGSALGWASSPGKIRISDLRGPYRVEVYERGRPSPERRLEAGSGEEQAVTRWFEAHPSGWKWTIVTDAPNRRIIGDRFTLNFTGELAVLNYEPRPGKSWTQVCRTIRKDEIPDVFGPAR